MALLPGRWRASAEAWLGRFRQRLLFAIVAPLLLGMCMSSLIQSPPVQAKLASDRELVDWIATGRSPRLAASELASRGAEALAELEAAWAAGEAPPLALVDALAAFGAPAQHLVLEATRERAARRLSGAARSRADVRRFSALAVRSCMTRVPSRLGPA